MEALLELKNIKKSFGPNHVLKGINLDIRPGEVHVLLGENGAGKSTLIKIMTGAYTKDEGEMFFQGKKIELTSPSDAMDLGIATIYQELNVVHELTVYENIFLGREIKNKIFLNQKKMKEEAARHLERLGQKRELLERKVGDLGIGKQQLVEIAKALTVDAKLIIMDEPTASLSGSEVEQLYATVNELRRQGIAIVFISHRLEEIKRMGDRVTVLRDGYGIDTLPVKETSADRMIELMVGRSLDEKFPKKDFTKGVAGLEIKNLKRKGSDKTVNLTAYQGEILGISGLVGAGRTELARAIFGVDPIESGTIKVFDKEVKIKSPRDAISSGIAFITEDRKAEGLILDQTLDFNVGIASLKTYQEKGFINLNKIKDLTNHYIKELQVRPSDQRLHARNLSGGNQQKIVIAKWLATKAKVFIFDEPTRGIDVGAKVEVYRLMNSLVDEGAIIIMISSDLPEILGMCDRVLVMCENEITGEFDRHELSQEKIMKAATGGR
ncbi:sugar ABC transporter ATP-binding protein [Alkalihalobacillus sp. MEB130]|uniref:sugar ABC transporter ATP-binding protein n=1 Tax=Alkalihalobacillus sp. MEB130 TaxID=2976704 RepID=UPI0028DD6344|nr:sugar ABC transporter ATP-binding protein [Alkalihalobacillus sp. MEB130]MDT8860132.1 sugar ABC transporter ATP-binding protein [Alkalihalobacillus sp. MEB130]